MSKIEEILTEKLREEFRNQLRHLRDVSEQSCNELEKCLKSNLEILKELELTDATMFDFFEKTKGNIRVTDFDSKHNRSLYTKTDYGEELPNQIILKENTKYKIILMAIEQER